MTALARTEPQLPTYRTAAAYLEGSTAHGWKLLGWTAGRTVLIAIPMMIVGIEPKKAILGSALASLIISGLAVARISNAVHPMLGGRRRLALAGRRRR
jgi:hypothetical protein